MRRFQGSAIAEYQPLLQTLHFYIQIIAHSKLPRLLGFPFVSAMIITTDIPSSRSCSLLRCLPHALAATLSASLIICSGFQALCDSIQRTKDCHYIYPYLSSFDAELNFALLM